MSGIGAWIDAAKAWAKRLKREIVALWLAARDNRVPLGAKLAAGATAAYALSPVDLIPDVIPVIGYLDDLVIVPLGILLAVRLVPQALMAEFRRTAAGMTKPISKSGLVFILAIWLVCLILAVTWLWGAF
ncbi:MAG: DUF1232 domain-containing protein [Neorhizobium sp.]|nr:DUF1232 domain-containing protein [Neorhizobium sp.]